MRRSSLPRRHLTPPPARPLTPSGSSSGSMDHPAGGSTNHPRTPATSDLLRLEREVAFLDDGVADPRSLRLLAAMKMP